MMYDDTVDYKGSPPNKSRTGSWRSTPSYSVLGAELAEKVSAFGAQFNMVNYLVGVKFLGKAYSANMVTNYLGAGYLITLAGGILADSFFGRFWTIVGAALIQMTGFVVLMLTALLPSLNNQHCPEGTSTPCRSAHGVSLSTLYLGLYLISIGMGGIKACVSAFGADQFDVQDPQEAQHLPHYFNLFFGCIEIGSLVASTLMIWIQDHEGFEWGYAVEAMIMGLALLLFVGARRLYRYRVPRGSPLTSVLRVVVSSVRNRNLPGDSPFYKGCEEEQNGSSAKTRGFRFLEKAAMVREGAPAREAPRAWKLTTLKEVEDTKMLLRLAPILLLSFFYWTCSIQFTTFAVYQAATMDRALGSLEVPSGTVGGLFLTLSILLALVLYDRGLMPLIERFTGSPAGVTPLRKIMLGFGSAALAMVVAALVEQKRLRIVKEIGAEDSPTATLPMSMFWLLPQYAIIGAGQALLYVGSLEFFYGESPRNMQSLGTALVSCSIGIGLFCSSAIVTAVNDATKGEEWLGNNMNRNHLDRYYWVLGGLSLVNLGLFAMAVRRHETLATSSAVVAADPDRTNSSRFSLS